MTTADINLPSARRADAISQATAVEQARAVAEVAAAVRVAQDNPRDEERAYAEMRRACGQKRMAERAFYAVRNRGNGPSVHLARELARIWGNNDYGVRELRRSEEDKESEILAYAWDQQTNMRSTRSFISPHARMAGGKRQPLIDLHDIYLSNQNTGARAVRECIFSVLPSEFVEEAQELCHATLARGDGKPLAERVKSAVDAYLGAGVTEDQLAERFGPVDQWTAETVANAGVLWASLQRNEVTLAESFPPAAPKRVTVAEIKQAEPRRHRGTPPARPPRDPAQDVAVGPDPAIEHDPTTDPNWKGGDQ